MQAERKSIVTASSAPSIERSCWLESTLVELGKLALSRQLSMTPECLLLMAQDLMDVPWQYLEIGDHGMAAGDVAHGEAGTDGPLPYRPAAAGAGETDRAGRQEVSAW